MEKSYTKLLFWTGTNRIRNLTIKIQLKKTNWDTHKIINLLLLIWIWTKANKNIVYVPWLIIVQYSYRDSNQNINRITLNLIKYKQTILYFYQDSFKEIHKIKELLNLKSNLSFYIESNFHKFLISNLLKMKI